jgi:cytochrome c biogenesis factor
MLIHPPVVFLGYALWTVPLALAVVALAAGGWMTAGPRGPTWAGGGALGPESC